MDEAVAVRAVRARAGHLRRAWRLEGRRLVPLLEPPDQPFKPAAFTEITRAKNSGHSIRTDRWRYTEWAEGAAGIELYDEQNDPEEFTNLATDAKLADVVRDLKTQLHAAFPATQPVTQ